MAQPNAIIRYADSQNKSFRAAVADALSQSNGSVAGAARIIGVYPSSLWRFIKKHQINASVIKTIGEPK